MKLRQITLNAGLKLLEFFLHDLTWTMRTGPAPGLKRYYGPGLLPRTLELTVEEAFLYQLQLKHATVYDVGGYIGLYALFFSRAVGEHGQVVTFEPNPFNYTELVANVQLNGCTNTRLLQYGISEQPGEAWFVRDPISPARGKVVAQRPPKGFKIQIESLDHCQQAFDLPAPAFIKIDVEGLEHAVIKGARSLIEQYHPEMLVEMHGQVQLALVQELRNHGYSLYHLEGAHDLSQGEIPVLVNGHVFCTMPGKPNWQAFRGSR